ncbi:MAG: tetratricopeptide repeat protein [Bacteroidales bacterium]|nr:tetratricopeptide repeat protein [Bacteroidales bacterium]
MQRFVSYVVMLFACVYACVAVAQKQTPEMRQSALYDQAMDLYVKEKYAAAQHLFDRIEASDDAEYYAAVCAVKLNNDDAVARLDDFLGSHASSAHCNMARFYMGNFYYSRNKYDKALAQYKKVKPNELEYGTRGEYNFRMGYCYLLDDKKKDAESCFKQEMGGKSRYSTASLYYYAHLKYDDGAYDIALKHFEKLKEEKNFAHLVPNYIIRIYYYTGRHEEVLAMAPAMLDNPDTYKAYEIAQMVADIYFGQGAYSDALKYYHKAAAGPSADDSDKSLASTVAPSRQACTPQDNFYPMGYSYYKLGQLDSAAFYLQKKTACDDSVAQNALYALGDIYLKQQRKDEARSMFLQSSKMDYNKSIQEEALLCYAKLSCELNKNPYNESIHSFQDYLKRYPATKHRAEVQEIIASLYLTTNNYKDAIAMLEKIDNRNMSLNQAYQRALLNYGVELFNKGRMEDASMRLKKAGEVNADVKVSSDAYYLYGEAQYRLGNKAQALKSIDRFLLSSNAAKSHYYYQGLYTMGYLCMEEKRYDEAYKYFRKIADGGDKAGMDKHQMCDTYNRMGDCRYVMRHYSDAIMLYDHVIELKDADADYAMMQKALAYGAKGDDDNKFRYLQQLFDTYNKSTLRPKALMEMADTYLKLDKNDMAMQKYEQYLQLYPKNVRAKDALLNIGIIYYNAKNDSAALAVFDRVLRQYPETDEARYAMGSVKNIYIEQNRVDDYFAYIKKVAHVSVSDIEKDSTIYLAAEDRYMSGDYASASGALAAYLHKYPNGLFSQKASYYAADSYHRLGQDDKALPYYLMVVAGANGKYSEESLYNAAGIAYDQTDYMLADSLYALLAERSENDANRVVGLLGRLRSNVRLDKNEAIEASAEALLKDEHITTEQREEALISMARVSYKKRDIQQILNRYEPLMTSANGEYSGEACYSRIVAFYNADNVLMAEKEINEYVEVASSDYWLAKTFILWADIYYKVHHNNLQAKQTLQSIIDNYDGDDLREQAKRNLQEIIDSEAADHQEEEPEMIIDIDE